MLKSVYDAHDKCYSFIRSFSFRQRAHCILRRAQQKPEHKFQNYTAANDEILDY